MDLSPPDTSADQTRQDRRFRNGAWLASVVAVVLTVWDGIIAAKKGAIADYDPIVALTGLTVVGLVWTIYFTRASLEHARALARTDAETRANDSLRQRESLATAVLAELRNLKIRMEILARDGPIGATVEFFSHPLLQLAATRPEVFRPHTIESLTATLRHLADLRELLRLHDELVQRRNEPRATFVENEYWEERKNSADAVKVRANWARNSVVRLASALIAEGGLKPSLPPERPVSVHEAIALLPDPFEDLDAAGT